MASSASSSKNLTNNVKHLRCILAPLTQASWLELAHCPKDSSGSAYPGAAGRGFGEDLLISTKVVVMECLPDVACGVNCQITILENVGQHFDAPWTLQMMRIVKLQPSRTKHMEQMASSGDVGVVLHQSLCWWHNSEDIIVAARPLNREGGSGAAILDLVTAAASMETLQTWSLQELLYGFHGIATPQNMCAVISFVCKLDDGVAKVRRNTR